ncbi:MAG: hypothetical protein Q7T76_09070 [Ferruginibacter sp.]|nr:hypothetical protein [Ferruginibacter sp.]
MKNDKTKQERQVEKEVCGIVMPISDTDSYPKGHWAEVKYILDDVIEQAGFTPNLVSYADESGLIHKRIIDNLFNNPILICDVSSKNPNVMFELGLRLAFDKATIIIKDDDTTYTFDAGVIEHLTYPKNLRFAEIEKFKIALLNKILSTHKKSLTPEYSTFLKNFIQYKPKLEEQELSNSDYMFKMFEIIQSQLGDLQNKVHPNFNKQEAQRLARDKVYSDNQAFFEGIFHHYSIINFEKLKDAKEDDIISEFITFLRKDHPLSASETLDLIESIPSWVQKYIVIKKLLPHQ